MNDQQVKLAIEAALQRFSSQPLADAGTRLLAELGYHSKKTLALMPNTPESFLATFAQGRTLNDRYALPGEWKSIDFLFQLTDDEIRGAASQQFDFDSSEAYSGAIIHSYLFLAIELKHSHYSRTALAGITREVNKLFNMPALILFRHGETLTLAIINRRLHKREEGKDVLEKVTLIQEIRCVNTHRAHIEILFDLSLSALYERHNFANFVELHAAWQKTLDTSALNKRFYQELANWYFWALTQVRFPKHAPKEDDGRDSVSMIRLITRVIFCWFLKEKGVIPDALFDFRRVSALLKDSSPNESTYYKAILQNLFFATLNQEMDKREFRKDGQHFMSHNLYRYRSLLKNPDEVLKLFAGIPFMNGGLFECLDKSLGTKEKPVYIRVDGFSDRGDNLLKISNELFFGKPRVVDLSDSYGDNRYQTATAEGLIGVLNRYKFTVAENTPIEEEVALDPELLGKVFENLLAAYNPETGATARKQTGSFYTPREIVNYMVDESLIATLKTKLETAVPGAPAVQERLRHLFEYNNEPHRFAAAEVNVIIEAVDHLKILDPACGSGAFPMGVLHKLVFVLGKLDPGNHRWKARQLTKAGEIADVAIRKRVLEEIEDTFEANEVDYGRKLYLIENCIYGVDIQPIAVQISKLRFFVSLVVEQKIDRDAKDLGIRPLPNLETKFVAANTLVGIERRGQLRLRNPEIEAKEAKLRKVREEHFLALTPAKKRRCREQDAVLRQEIAELLKKDDWDSETASKLASWDPYDQNTTSEFFDVEWMFGITSGFDVTIGNPPYVRADEQSADNKRVRELVLASGQYETLWEKWDLFVAFIEKGFNLLSDGGITTMIVSDAYCHSKYAQKSQKWFLKNGRVLRLDFCTDLQIFEAAVHNLIYTFQRAGGIQHKPERRVHRGTFGNCALLSTDEQQKLTYRAFSPDSVDSLCSVPSIPLAALCYISYGLAASSDEKLYKGEFVTEDVVQDTRDATHPKRYIEGKDIRAWYTPRHRFLEWGTKRAPRKFRRQTFLELHEASHKLMTIVVTSGSPPVMFDDLKRFTTHTSCIFVPWHLLQGVRNNSLKKAARYRGEKPPRPDLPKREELEAESRRFSVKYLLGVMNSAPAREFLRANRRSNIHLYPDDWKQLPIPDVPSVQQQPIISVVDQILEAKRANANANLTVLEAELNTRVAALYGPAQSATSVAEEGTFSTIAAKVGL